MSSDIPISRANRPRLDHLDALRGYALLGVLLMNIHFWFRTCSNRYALADHPWPGFLNVAADYLLGFWFSGKSVTIFSMLFAAGLCLQREHRVEEEGTWLPFIFRRLAALLALGALHVLLLWDGDILIHYTLTGLLILPFLGRRPRTVGLWAIILLALPLVWEVVKGYWNLHHPSVPGSPGPGPEAQIQAMVEGFRQTSWVAALKHRLHQWVLFHQRFWPIFIKGYAPLFLVGLWVWKQGWIQAPESHRCTWVRIARWGLGLGLPLNLLMIAPMAWFEPRGGFWRAIAQTLALYLATNLGLILMSLGLMAGFLLLWQQPRAQRILRHLTPVGRLGLSTYLSQSLICTAIFHGWGLGLYDRLGPAWGLALGLGIFAFQMALARLWLRRFQTGPVEWLWRTFSYREAPRFARLEPTQAVSEAG